MALDKQRILSELGDVMNQLQSADCGCMNNVFSNPGQGGCMGSPLPTCGGCRRGTCPGHGGGNHFGGNPAAGDPYSMNNMQGGMNAGAMNSGGMSPGGMNTGCCRCMNGGCMRKPGMNMPFAGQGMGCMGRQAPKLYADTYNYLNENLMQPTVKEVYNDLSTITPQNTIGANPLAGQMGLPAGGAGGQMVGGGMGNPMQSMGSPMQNMGGAPTGNNPMDMSGMGAQIVNMMMKGGSGRPAGQMNDSMLIDAPHSPHGQVGITPVSMGGSGMSNMTPGNPGQPNAGNMGMSMGQNNQPITQYATHDNMYTANLGTMGNNTMNPALQQVISPVSNINSAQPMANANPASHPMAGGMAQPVANVNSASNPMAGNMAQPMANANLAAAGGMSPANPNTYGQHTAGMTKFNEMFPGVTNQGDLKFDPMAIAIQMNPANQQRAAMDAMTKMLTGNKNLNSMMQPAMAGSNAAASAIGQGNQMTNQQLAPPVQQNQLGNQEMTQGQQQAVSPGNAVQPNQQQVYTAQTGAPVANQQMLQQQVPQQIPQNQMQGQAFQQGQPQQQIDPNTGAPIMTGYEAAAPQGNNPSARQEPVYTADTQNVYYNTLGQPVNMVPGNLYNRGMPGLPQTLDGAPMHYGVRSIPSKTVLANTKSIGKVASRSQLQHIYRQYKASHSATQQNIRPPPVQGGSVSEGNLNPAAAQATNAHTAGQIPVEKVGGDSLATNPNNPQDYTVAAMPETIGDVPSPAAAMNKQPNYVENSLAAVKQRSGRNGMQDSSYTTYRSPGWSFHG